MSPRQIVDGKTYLLKKKVGCVSCVAGVKYEDTPDLCNKLGLVCSLGESNAGWIQIKKKHKGK